MPPHAPTPAVSVVGAQRPGSGGRCNFGKLTNSRIYICTHDARELMQHNKKARHARRPRESWSL